MFRMLRGSTWGTAPLLRPSMPKDPTVKAQLYAWSSEEFFKEFALVYSSRYDPSQTCVSYCRLSRNKVLFTLSDCLCEGNPVRVDMELSTQRDNLNGLVMFRDARVDESKGSFIVRTAVPGVSLLRYQDKFRQRTGQTHGNFNGANFRDCHITIDSKALQLKGFNNFHSS
ncbi:uncharacterized protein LOC114763281 isoform X2 [Neltuma alba]|uniref:uncharacterized protein LOC114738878 isoform X2 n=1 Tax=Neltuma alba TaxID=207710 RepID=UPI0010A33CC3|nr:uncharacterized protein LOC114738878 isoform X2 [Prosopis alba]XP_028808744.1 uncharacterized protein LOC114763281 isoform X2 [Prosopis alba]